MSMKVKEINNQDRQSRDSRGMKCVTTKDADDL